MVKRGKCNLICETNSDGIAGQFHILAPGFYVGEHLFVNPKTGELNGTVKTGRQRTWCISHVHSGKLLVGPASKITSPLTAVTIAVEILRLSVNWEREDPTEDLDDNMKHVLQQRIREVIAAETHRLSNITDEIFTPENAFPYPVGKYSDDGIYVE